MTSRNCLAWGLIATLSLMAALGLTATPAHAQAPDTPPRTATPAVEAPDTPERTAAPATDTPAVEADDDAGEAAENADAEEPIVWTRDRGPSRRRHRRNGDELVSFGSNSTLRSGETADSVVSIFGSSTSQGEVRDAIVSIFGNTRVEGGSVGDAAVSVVGDSYINAEVNGDVVSVFGSLELGPKADLHGEVVVVGGTLTRDPAARVRGPVQHVLAMPPGSMDGLRSWLKNCLGYMRPLAFAPNLGWAWTIALGFLGLYVFLALMFRDPVDRCVKTLQEYPGQTVLASLLAMLLTPVLFVVMCITIIGIAFVPIAGFGLFLATLFGKVVVLAWIGRGVLKAFDEGQKLQTVVAVLVGGAIVLLLYVVPGLGFIVFKLLGILAFGVVVYTVLRELQARRKPLARPPTAGGTAAAGAAAFAATSEPSPASDAERSSAEVGETTAGPGEATAGAENTGAGAGSAAGTAGATPNEASAGSGAGGPQTPPPGPTYDDAATLPRPGFWIRMLALFIDAMIIGAGTSMIFHGDNQFLVILAAYGAIMWKLKGTTVGGIVCNLKVVRVDGRPLDWSTAIVRALSCFLSLIAVGLGFIWIAFDEGRQGWHDKIAGTAVVRVPQGISLL